MMDGRMAEVSALDADGLRDVGAMAYSARYAPAFYSPLPIAASSATGEPIGSERRPARVPTSAMKINQWIASFFMFRTEISHHLFQRRSK
jgi:delta-aminolevulinic acid dehydratase/porphobilinogen synthase